MMKVWPKIDIDKNKKKMKESLHISKKKSWFSRLTHIRFVNNGK